MVQGPSLETEQIASLYQLPVLRRVVYFSHDRFVQTGGHYIDQLHGRDELAVLLGCHLARYKDTQMPDRLMHRIYDRLANLDDFPLILVQIQDPVQRLMW